MEERGPNWLLHKYPDCLYGKHAPSGAEPAGDCFYFDYGCVAFWGLNIKQVRVAHDPGRQLGALLCGALQQTSRCSWLRLGACLAPL